MNTLSPKGTLCVYVKSPEGVRVQCKVIEVIPSLFSLLPQVGVKAIHGRPFNGQNIAVVPMLGVTFESIQRAEAPKGKAEA